MVQSLMKLKYALYLAAGIALLSACNKKDDSAATEAEEISYTSVAVNSFSLKKDADVLANLDSVFFSIDLNNAVVFNADSLPRGTKVDNLVLKIGLPTLTSAEIIEAPDADGNVRTVDYLTSPDTAIDFTNGDATLRLVSYDGASTRDYTIKVNVHRVDADMLAWGNVALSALPGNVASPTAQKTVCYGGNAYCFVTDGSVTRLSVSANPASDPWTTRAASLPADARIETVTAAGDALYVLGADGTLYTSADGETWQSTSETMHWLYGDYDGRLMGCRQSGANWEVTFYPSMTALPMPAGFPVDGTSALVSTDNKWASSPLAVMIGGRRADGSLTGDTWGFDGSTFAVVNNVAFPEDLEGMTLIPYLSYVTRLASWTGEEYPSLIAFGGRNSSGEPARRVYLSVDGGINWKIADDLMQLPEYIPSMSGADALVFNTVLGAGGSRGDGWVEMPARQLPPWLQIARPMAGARGEVSTWECPYIYLFGGIGADGRLEDSVWRGVINRLTFKPLW